MNNAITHIENLIRVLHKSDPSAFDLDRWSSCAIGCAARDHYFYELGLSMPTAMGPAYDGYTGFAALEHLFDIEPDEVLELFCQRHYRDDMAPELKATASDVIAKLEVVLGRKLADEIWATLQALPEIPVTLEIGRFSDVAPEVLIRELEDA